MNPLHSWELIGVVVLIVVVFYLVFSEVEDRFDDWRSAQAAKERRRLALRQNINALITSLVEAGDGQDCVLLDRALQDSIVEYRILC